jgi:hypothetical protein
MPRLLRTYPGLKPWDYEHLHPTEIDELLADLKAEDREIARQNRNAGR